MSFAIPRNDDSKMIIYIWKIVDLPSIYINDLLYKISFELFLFSPKDAKIFIKKAISSGALISNNDQELSLSEELAHILKNWHKQRRVEILENINSSANLTKNLNKFKRNNSNKFNILLKAFLDTGTINRAVLVSDNSFNINIFDPSDKSISALVKGSQKTPYFIEISSKKKVLKHNCHDFLTKRAQNKKFCKHLAKLFLILKEKDEVGATSILENISKEINKWDFVS